MNPVNMVLPAGAGYAVASSKVEMLALEALGYISDGGEIAPSPDDADPAESDGAGHTVESVRLTLDAAGIDYDRRLGLAKLVSLLPP